MEAVYQFGSKIKRATYSVANNILKVTFIKPNGLEERTYNNVPKKVGCKLIYAQGRTAAEVMQLYSTTIRGKYQVLEIKQPKF